ncbi:MAG: hypothetical protein ACRDLZ_05370, partial [Gaiellaceae bacterium]
VWALPASLPRTTQRTQSAGHHYVRTLSADPGRRARLESSARVSDHVVTSRRYYTISWLLIVLLVLLVAFAIAGGVMLSKLLWLLLILALVVFAVGAFTGRITE